MTVRDRAVPYAERLLDDHQLQRDLREAMAALRSSFNRAESKKRKPSRLIDDKKFKRSAQRAAASLKDASARFQGEPPKKHRGRKLLIALVAVGGLALAARKVFADEGIGASSPEFSPTS
jgi:hypothetical protein